MQDCSIKGYPFVRETSPMWRPILNLHPMQASSLLQFVIGEDYQELTQKEENDLEYMISQTENAISHIEVFTEQLSKDLSVLDGVIK